MFLPKKINETFTFVLKCIKCTYINSMYEPKCMRVEKTLKL